MHVWLRTGQSFWITDARRYEVKGGCLLAQTARARVIAQFPITAVAGWAFEGEDIVTFGFDDRADKEMKQLVADTR